MDLNKKRIILTGGATGIGKALLNLLLSYDVQIVVGDLYPEKIQAVPDRLFPLKCDVSRQVNVDFLFQIAEKEMGGVDIFIANAGFAYYEKIEKEDWDHIKKIYHTNLISPIYAIEKMKALNRGRAYCVVVIASAMSKLPLPGYALYASTKAALDSFAYA